MGNGPGRPSRRRVVRWGTSYISYMFRLGIPSYIRATRKHRRWETPKGNCGFSHFKKMRHLPYLYISRKSEGEPTALKPATRTDRPSVFPPPNIGPVKVTRRIYGSKTPSNISRSSGKWEFQRNSVGGLEIPAGFFGLSNLLGYRQ